MGETWCPSHPHTHFLGKSQSVSSGPVEIFLSPLFYLSSIEDDKLWSPARAVKWYLDKTKPDRKFDQLFLIFREPYSPAGRDTISRWLVDAIRVAGSEALVSGVRPLAHDTRSVSTSWALTFHGDALDDICKANFWSLPNSFIAFYLKDVPASGEESFAAASLRAASSSLVSLGTCPQFHMC